MRAPYQVLGSFGSLEELFEVLDGPQCPALPHGGSVRVHPGLLPERSITEFVRARIRLEPLGLRLVLTPAAGFLRIELRRNIRPRQERPAV